MKIKGKDIQVLYDLGLTRLQAEIYLTLLKLGKSKVKTISLNSDTARQEVYRVLKEIEGLDIIEKILTYPTEYRALPFSEVVSNLLKQRDRKTRVLKRKIRDSIIDHKNEKIASNETENAFILIPKKQRFIKKIQQSMQEAKNQILIITSNNRFCSSRKYYDKTIKDAFNRGVTAKLITEKAISEKILMESWSNYKTTVKYVVTPPPVVLNVIDRKQVFLITSAVSNFAGSSALWSNNFPLVKLAHSYFEMVWLSAIDYSLKKQYDLKEIIE